MINISKLFQEAAQSQCTDQRDSRKAFADDQVNLENIKLKIESCTWTDLTQPGNRKHCETMQIAGPGDAVGHLERTNKNPNFMKVTFKNGTVRGLNKQLELPLDSKRKDLIKEFGSYRKVDISKDLFTPIHEELDYGFSVDVPVGPSGATATVCKMGNDYKGNFVCRVIMKGIGVSPLGEQPIEHAIAHLKKTQPQNPDLKALDVVDRYGKKVVAFTLEGELECKWGHAYTANWK